jgi:uncharacterized lipoprotein YmbA
MRHKADIRPSKQETLTLAHRPPRGVAVNAPAGAILSALLRWPGLARLSFALAVCLGLTGCFGFLKPVRSTARQFVLTSLPANDPGAASSDLLGVGVGQVKVPAYLFNSSMAVRKGTNEIVYSTSALWAEHLDSGIQRVLAANLATLLHTDRVRLSAWRTEDVSAEVYVAIEQFDVDTGGKAAMAAWWRILAPGGEKTLKAGTSRLERQGPAPETDPSGAVGTLSELLAEFSRQLAQTVEGAIRK